MDDGYMKLEALKYARSTFVSGSENVDQEALLKCAEVIYQWIKKTNTIVAV